MQTNFLSIAAPLTGVVLSLAVVTGAYACGGILDVACNLANGGMSPGNIIRQTNKAVQDTTDIINGTVQAATSGPAAAPIPSPVPMGAFCYTAAGRFGPGPILPQGATCFVPLPQGTFPGRVGP